MVESPAGLVDAGEDAKVAAERELLEETGFSGKVVSVSPIVPCDPGMTNGNMRCVRVQMCVRACVCVPFLAIFCGLCVWRLVWWRLCVTALV